MKNEFLFKKFNYKTLEVKSIEDVEEMEWDFATSKTRFFAYDTETTGLNFMKDVPFLIIFGFEKHVYDMFFSMYGMFWEF